MFEFCLQIFENQLDLMKWRFRNFVGCVQLKLDANTDRRGQMEIQERLVGLTCSLSTIPKLAWATKIEYLSNEKEWLPMIT